MTRKIVTELARYYLMSHGIECEEMRKTWFIFTYRKQRFKLTCWRRTGVDITPFDEDWFDVDLEYCDVDERDPTFDPEVYFKPLLNKLEDYTA